MSSLFATVLSGLFATVLLVLAVFLILLVLVQRGRGGGLAGALGGMGGSSAFGAKAGDVFTRVTIVTAAIWIAVCVAAVYWANHRGDRLGTDMDQAAPISSSTTDTPAGDASSSGAATSMSPAAESSDTPAADP